MTNPLGQLVTTAENLATAPLEFTRHMAQEFQDYIIGAFSKPLPATDPIAAYRYNEARAKTLQDGFRQRPLIRMQDKNLNQLVTRRCPGCTRTIPMRGAGCIPLAESRIR